MIDPVKKIVSGAQTGADRAALDWAISRGIPHSGWCSKGRKAEDGRIPVQYQVQETPSADYLQRNEWIVRDSNGTATPMGFLRHSPLASFDALGLSFWRLIVLLYSPMLSRHLFLILILALAFPMWAQDASRKALAFGQKNDAVVDLSKILRWGFANKSSREILAAQTVTRSLFLYTRVGYDERVMAFGLEGRIKSGAGRSEQYLDLCEEDGGFLLCIYSDSSRTSQLRREHDGIRWGQWDAYEQMPIVLKRAKKRAHKLKLEKR